MVFGLFGKRKDTVSIAEPEGRPEPDSVRSPSPASASISEAIQPPQTPKESQKAIDENTSKSAPLSSSISNAGPSMDFDLPPSDPSELLSLLKKVPPKALYDYVVHNVPDASPQELSSLLEFFKSLTPPPKLHCVRCHKEYVEIENTDRSCHVAHDDESALVEKVGKAGTTYETLWGCCNRIVEGDGDQGPPDGWCYEGFHTTDIKRARFRADSTLQDDKLVSCKRMRCSNGEEEAVSRGRSERASARKSMKEVSDEEEDYDMHELVREAEILTGKSGANRGSKKKPAKPEPVDKVTDDLASISVARSNPKSKAGSMKPRSTAAKSTSSAADASTSMASVRSEIRAGEDITMTTSPPAQEPVAQPKKKRRARKSVAADGGRYKPSKSDEELSESDEEPEKPRRKRTKRKSTVDNATVS